MMRFNLILIGLTWLSLSFWSEARRLPWTSTFLNCTDLDEHCQKLSDAPSLVTRKPLVDAYPADDYIELFQFDNAVIDGQSRTAYYEDIVKQSIVQVNAMLSTTMAVLRPQNNAPNPNNPSFLRYFDPNRPGKADETTIDTLCNIYESILQYLGAPMFAEQRRSGCYRYLPRLHIYYLDPPEAMYAGNSPCADTGPGSRDTGKFAYVFRAKPGYQDGIALCERFFLHFTLLTLIRRSNLEPQIEYGFRHAFEEPSYLSAQTLLHEMLHYDLVYGPTFTTPFENIIDALIHDPGRDQVFKAYGAWTSIRAKEWVWRDEITGQELPVEKRNALYNVDSYVFCALEIYLKQYFGLADWQDPPSPFGGPHLPPGHPLDNPSDDESDFSSDESSVYDEGDDDQISP